MSEQPADPNSAPSPDALAKYFEVYGLPYIIAHLNMRTVGLQAFTAIQGGLLFGWATHPHYGFPIIGLGACLSFYLWDARNRFIFSQLRAFGERCVDRPLFGPGADENTAADGINKLLSRTITESGGIADLSAFQSHTWAIRVLLILGTGLWIIAPLTQLFSYVTAIAQP